MHVLLCAVLILIYSYFLDVELRHFVQHRQHVGHTDISLTPAIRLCNLLRQQLPFIFIQTLHTGDAGWSCFIKIDIIFFLEHSLSVTRFGSRSGPRFYVGPDLGQNCLQRLSADENSCKRYMYRLVLRMRDKYECYLKVTLLHNTTVNAGLLKNSV